MQEGDLQIKLYCLIQNRQVEQEILPSPILAFFFIIWAFVCSGVKCSLFLGRVATHEHQIMWIAGISQQEN